MKIADFTVHSAWALGCCGGIAVALLVLLAIRFVKTKILKQQTCEYDERQIAVRGKAYKTGFITLCAFEFFSIVIKSLCEITILPPAFWHMIALFVAFEAFIVSCIRHDAYFTPNHRNSIGLSVSFVLLGGINLALFIIDGGFTTVNGVLKPSFINFCSALFLFTIVINVFIKKCVQNTSYALQEAKEAEETQKAKLGTTGESEKAQ